MTSSPSNMMRAAVLTAPGRVEVKEVPLPEPQKGQVRLRLEGSGLCASSVPAYEGRAWFNYPLPLGQPGHEGWGVIHALGPETTGLHIGQRVAALTYSAFAEYDLAQADAVVPLPPFLDAEPFPGEAFACALNIFARAGIEPGQTVAILGIGFLGGALTQLCANAGARVFAISRRRSSLQLAESLGAEVALVMEDHATVVREVMAVTHCQGCARVIECVGLQWPLDLATDLTATRGRLVVAGYHQDGPRQVNMQQWNWRGMDVINAHEREPQAYVRGMREAVLAVVQGRLSARRLVTHTFELNELQRAFTAQRSRPDGFVKAIVRCS